MWRDAGNQLTPAGKEKKEKLAQLKILDELLSCY